MTPRGSCADGREELAAMLDSFTHAREAALRLSLLRGEDSAAADAASANDVRGHGRRKPKKRSSGTSGNSASGAVGGQ